MECRAWILTEDPKLRLPMNKRERLGKMGGEGLRVPSAFRIFGEARRSLHKRRKGESFAGEMGQGSALSSLSSILSLIHPTPKAYIRPLEGYSFVGERLF